MNFPWIPKPGLPDRFFIMFISKFQYIYLQVETFINPNPLTLDQNITIVRLTRSTKYHGKKTIMPKILCKPHAQNHGQVRPTSRGKNITYTQHSPTCCFLSTQGVTGELSHWSIPAIPIVSLHQENFLVLIYFVNVSKKFFIVYTS